MSMNWIGRSIALVFATAMVANAADSQDVLYRVKILPQPLGTALKEFADQSGMQIIFLSKVTEGHDAPESGTIRR
jgi:hypothetical protein